VPEDLRLADKTTMFPNTSQNQKKTKLSPLDSLGTVGTRGNPLGAPWVPFPTLVETFQYHLETAEWEVSLMDMRVGTLVSWVGHFRLQFHRRTKANTMQLRNTGIQCAFVWLPESANGAMSVAPV
jgi:hypothetical protein